MQLTNEEQEWKSGASGDAMAMAIRILEDMGRILGADRLIPISSAHIDGCLYHGDSGVAFADRLVQGGGRIRVPTTLNVGALNLLKPGSTRLPSHERTMAQRLMKAYLDMGCSPTWTCAPYQAGHRPAKGTDVAWAESNAVVFVNSVLGARTNRYGDFLDICSALTGRAPRYGLHIPENRRATIVISTHSLSDRLKRQSSFYPVLGAWLGRTVGSEIAVIDGLPADTSEDCLKALGASAASTGAVALFHVTGVTPEASTLAEACGYLPPEHTIEFTAQDVTTARKSLSTTGGNSLDAIALGSPHYSIEEFVEFERLRGNRRFSLPVYICTGRHTLQELEKRNMVDTITAAGVDIVSDTCVVVTPILPAKGSVLMTDSGKFSHYTPSNTGYEVVYGSVSECVESAVHGTIIRSESDWT